MNELKPCPFCGYVPQIVLDGQIYTLSNNHKSSCFIRRQNGYNPGRMSAFNWQCIAEVWNRRAEDAEKN